MSETKFYSTSSENVIQPSPLSTGGAAAGYASWACMGVNQFPSQGTGRYTRVGDRIRGVRLTMKMSVLLSVNGSNAGGIPLCRCLLLLPNGQESVGTIAFSDVFVVTLNPTYYSSVLQQVNYDRWKVLKDKVFWLSPSNTIQDGVPICKAWKWSMPWTRNFTIDPSSSKLKESQNCPILFITFASRTNAVDQNSQYQFSYYATQSFKDL